MQTSLLSLRVPSKTPFLGIETLATLVILVGQMPADERPTGPHNAAFSKTKTSPILVEPNILVSRDGNVPHLETVLAANPKDPNNFVGAAIVFARADGGMTCKTYAS